MAHIDRHLAHNRALHACKYLIISIAKYRTPAPMYKYASSCIRQLFVLSDCLFAHFWPYEIDNMYLSI